MKTKLVQNVNRMSERQNDMPKDRLTDGQTDRKTGGRIIVANRQSGALSGSSYKLIAHPPVVL